MFKLDDLLKKLGEFGPYQRRVFAITCTIVFFSSWVSMIPVFLAATVDHWCEVSLDSLSLTNRTPEWTPGCEQYGLSEEACALAQKEGSIPSNYTSDGELEYAQCEKYNVSGVGFWPGIDPSNYSSETMSCDSGWVWPPESARWLISVGKFDKAEKVITKVAEVNKAELQKPLFTKEFMVEQERIRKEHRPTGLDLIRTPRMRMRTINLVFIW
ncbi:solute carrier family 22 member 5-like [Strongylocentrotus purpuratus]|uniref:Uncharacterized protein n=1 Tax=Strongylocentrotus purpuratus TaxID=7668 RepID=A0A7M7PJ31_STRPU|nr:solute carrier family 22 member 5-like [Strongylocentrotus purpuratus]